MPTGAGSRDLVPTFPGMSDAPSLEDWDPPFPIDLSRIRPVDEQYWDDYRTTPKAFVAYEVGRDLWRSRYGEMTSIRVPAVDADAAARERAALAARLRDSVDPLALGLTVRAVRAEGMSASRGATDFGQYFVYFSFFLVVSALLLVSLFFKLGIEQRAREVGLLRAVGYDTAAVRRLFLGEGCVLAGLGSALGLLGAVGYAWLIMTGLGTWWVDAVGTTALSLHVSATSLLAGAAGGMLAAVVCIWWTLRSLRRVSERSLLAGQVSLDDDGRPPATRRNAEARGGDRAGRGCGRPRRRCGGRGRSAGRRVLRRRRLDAGGVSLPVRVGAPPPSPPCRRRPRLAAGVAARHQERDATGPGAACCRRPSSPRRRSC